MLLSSHHRRSFVIAAALITASVASVGSSVRGPIDPDDIPVEGEGEEGEGEGEGEGECTPANFPCSASDNLCLAAYTCSGEDDPAASCLQALADQDDEQRACSAACTFANEPAAQCALEFGTCEDGTYNVAFDGECEDAFQAAADCANENC